MQSSLVPVNLKAMPASALGPNDKFVFRNNSAGLGVPRGNFGKLNSFANQTNQHGMATTTVYYGGQRAGGAEGGARPSSANAGYSANSPSYSGNASRSMGSASMGAPSHTSMQSAPSGAGGGARR
jgi:hypothetical protein